MKKTDHIVKFLSCIAFIQLIGCRHNKDKRPIEKGGDEPQAFLIQGANAKVFQDISSELRCEALKDYFTQFAAQALDNGKLENFLCEDQTWLDQDDYSVTLQLKSGDRTSALWLHIFGLTLTGPYYCHLPFSEALARECESGQFYYVGEVGNKQSLGGLIHPNMRLFREFFIQYITQPQTVDLAFGMDAQEFASVWISKFNAGEKLSVGSESRFEVGLRFSQSEDILKGTVEITDINEDALSRYGFLSCTTKECLLGKAFPYIFNGHRLSIIDERRRVFVFPLVKP